MRFVLFSIKSFFFISAYYSLLLKLRPKFSMLSSISSRSLYPFHIIYVNDMHSKTKPAIISIIAAS